MTSYFELFNEYEGASTATDMLIVHTQTQNRSVLGEISQNTRMLPKARRITRIQECQKRTMTRTRITKFIPQNKENSFPTLTNLKTSTESLENLPPVSSVFKILDKEVEKLNCNTVYISDDSKDSFPLQNNSLNDFSFHPFGGETSGDNTLPVPEYFKEDNEFIFSPLGGETSRDNTLPVLEYFKEDNEFNFHPIGEDVLSDIFTPVPDYSKENNEISFHSIGETISSDDILKVSEYSKEICEYLKSREVPVMAVCDYMLSQPDVTFSMRATLVDWLVEVAEEYKLNTGTIYLAVAYIDRFLSQMAVERSKLQLVGTASMLIAAKFEEIYPPRLKEFVFITDNSYTKQEVLQMEQLVLQVLDFDVSTPTSHQFLTHYCRMLNLDDKVLHLALYLNELSLLDGDTFLKFSASVLAASSVALARHTLGLEAWPDAAAAEVGYSLDDLHQCIIGLMRIFVEAPSLDQQAIREKYMASKLSKAAEVCPVDIM